MATLSTHKPNSEAAEHMELSEVVGCLDFGHRGCLRMLQQAAISLQFSHPLNKLHSFLIKGIIVTCTVSLQTTDPYEG